MSFLAWWPRGLPGRLIGFGMLAAFSSSVGQTFFIALSNTAFRAAHDLSSTELASLYGMATLASAVVMLFAGRLIDHLDLRAFTVLAAFLPAAGAVLVGRAEGLAAFVAGLFLLRLGGQGLLSHLAAVAVARTAPADRRGRATAIALLGHALGEAVLPILWVMAMGVVAWRVGWTVAALGLVLAFLPVALVTMPPAARRQPGSHAAGPSGAARKVSLLAEQTFLLLLVCVALPGTVLTATVFHLQILSALPPGAPAPGLAIPALAAGAVAGTVAAGLLADRIGAAPTLVLALLPLGGGCALFVLPQTFAILLATLLLMGTATGMAQAASAPAWAELFGTAYVGRARSYQAFTGVAGTAAAPVVYGMAMDAGAGVPLVQGTAAVAIAAVLVGAAWRVRREKTGR